MASESSDAHCVSDSAEVPRPLEVALCLCVMASMLVVAWKASAQAFRADGWLVVTGRWLLLLLCLLGFGVLVTSSESAVSLRHWVAFVFIMCFFSPYLRRPSRYHIDTSLGCVWTDKDKYRELADVLIVSSAVYALAGMYSLWNGEIHLGIMQIITCFGSSFYHLFREAQFFNLDNIFATSLLGTTAWSIMHAYSEGFYEYALFVLFGLPLAAFFLAYCGMPADIKGDSASGKVTRVERPIYDLYHTAWHFVSGFGCVVCAFYFGTYAPGRECGTGNFPFYWFSEVPIGPTVCLLFGVSANVLGNVFGIMPLD